MKRAQNNQKVLFQEIKRFLDKAEEASQQPGGSYDINVYPNSRKPTPLSECKAAIRDRRLFRYLYDGLMGNAHVLVLLSKNEWVQFVRFLLGMLPGGG